jgi:hypothetical protein
MLNNKNYTPEQEVLMENGVKQAVDSVTVLFGRKPSFREFINHVLEILGNNKDTLQTNFDKYVKGWELNGYKKDDYNAIYNEMFDPTRESTLQTYSLIQEMFEQDDSLEKEKNIGLSKKVTRITNGKMLFIGLIISSIITLICCCNYRNEIITFLSNWFTVYLLVIILNIIHCVQVRKHWEKFDITEQYFSIPVVSVALTFLVYLYLGFFLALSRLIMQIII